MTRKQNITIINKKRAKRKEEAIYNTITGLFKHEYIKKSGKWHISKIAKDTNIARDTVAKYLNGI